MANRTQAMQGVPAKVTESGALQLPAELRKAIGLDRGGDVVVELHGREIRIRAVEDIPSASNQLPSSPRTRGSTDSMDARFRGHDDKRASDSVQPDRALEDVVARAQELTREFFKGKPMPTVDEFLAERRRDTGR
jgi:bifunctional DNA-binding transcriptional regulator/antitoxin component of YhaV-PrlF toxin-antitoxin module